MKLRINQKNQINQVNHKDNWNITKQEEILQNVSNLILLSFTELPLNRQLGVSRDFIHKSPSVAQLKVFKEIERNIKNYEPRVIINKIEFNKIDVEGVMDIELDIDFKEV